MSGSPLATSVHVVHERRTQGALSERRTAAAQLWVIAEAPRVETNRCAFYKEMQVRLPEGRIVKLKPNVRKH